MEQEYSVGPSDDMKAFREIFAKAKSIVVLSGAGMSAESGVPTFRFSLKSHTQHKTCLCVTHIPLQGSWWVLENLSSSGAGNS